MAAFAVQRVHVPSTLGIAFGSQCDRANGADRWSVLLPLVPTWIDKPPGCRRRGGVGPSVDSSARKEAWRGSIAKPLPARWICC